MYTPNISPEGEPLGGINMTDWDGGADNFRRNFESAAGLGVARRLTRIDWQR